MTTDKLAYTIHVAKDTIPGHLSEDTYFIHTSEQSVVLMVGDGAPQRVKTTGSMRPLLDRYSSDMTPGGYAARYGRDRLQELLIADPSCDLKNAILQLNAEIGQGLADIYGALTVEAVLQHEPTLDLLREDPRYVRLILPAACITAARVDLVHQTVEIAHGADTALIIHYDDGRVVQVTPDQMGQHDARFLKRLQELVRDGMRVEDYPASEAKHMDILNGVYHNYADEHGGADHTVGVGVLNGMPELEHYLVTDTLSLAGVQGLLLISDGAYWASPLSDAEATHQQRLELMAEKVIAHGIDGYVREKRVYDAQDFPMEQFPVVGRNDDIVMLYMQFG
ncbi:MAG: hypothetical protein AAF125_07535 [Chloroflexota bacterium]